MNPVVVGFGLLARIALVYLKEFFRLRSLASCMFSRVFTAADKKRQLEDALMLGDPVTERAALIAFVSFYQGQAKVFETQPMEAAHAMETR
jgi:hypothetical protein